MQQGYIFQFFETLYFSSELLHCFFSRFFIMEFTFKNNPDRNISKNIVKFIYNICFYCKS
jgi:hypothetical protein